MPGPGNLDEFVDFVIRGSGANIIYPILGIGESNRELLILQSLLAKNMRIGRRRI